jgi:glycosyltransferase involved in cell wall biosynthesis
MVRGRLSGPGKLTSMPTRAVRNEGEDSMTASEQPLVAVLTPVYNGGKYLAETMACVQAQTYPNLVHVVLDNASTDTTPEIISRYLNSRVPVVTKRNSALLPQRENYNATVALAPAEARYLKILAADDLMRPDAIARLVDVCERNPNVTTASCLDCYNGTVRSIDLDPTRETHPGREFAERAAFLRENLPPYHHIFWRRSAAPPGDIFTLPFHADADAFQHLCRAGDVGFVFEPLVFTREHEDTVSAQDVRSKLHFWNEFLLSMHEAERFDDETRRRGVRRALHRYLRFVMRSALSGDLAGARIAHARLGGSGYAVGVWEYAATLLGYPAYFVAKLRRLIRAKAAVRGRNFDVQAEWQTSAPGQSSSNIFRTLGLR